MKQSNASEKLRVIDIFKENASMVIAIGGFCWIIYSSIITPIKSLEFSVGDIIGNHLKTIQDEQVTATEERKSQTEKLDKLSGELIRLTTILEQNSDKKILVP
jgi:hypothetical protein